MASHLSRKELKHDAFVEEVGHQVHFLAQHRKQVVVGLVVVIALIVGIASFVGYQRTRAAAANAALQDAVRLFNGTVTTEQAMGRVTFATTGERNRRVTEALEGIKSEYSGTDQAAAADYYLGLLNVEEGEYDAAKTHLQVAVAGAGPQYSSLARLTLANVLGIQGDVATAREHYDALVKNPSEVVPADRAKLELARMLADKDPEAAKPLLEELVQQPGPVSVAAGSTLRRLQGSS